MLKIKDNVDLKELEKFGLEFYEYEESGFKYESYLLGEDDAQIIIKDEIDNLPTGLITTIESNYFSHEEVEKLYDLIKADLVEKVGEIE